MKVGTDGTLLGAWATVPAGCGRILDIGTGTGVIALMAAQRSPLSAITGIEIDAQSAACARRNAVASAWSERIDIVNAPVQEYFPDVRFDLVVSNPPFYDAALPCPDAVRSRARHTLTLSFGELFAAARRLLRPEGRFAVIIPSDSVRSFVSAGDMHLVRRCDVRTVPSRPPKRTLLEFSPLFCGPVQFDELTIGDGCGGCGVKYRELMRDFYLDF